MDTTNWMGAVTAIWITLMIAWDQTQAQAYERQVLVDLCQFIGVKYARDPDNIGCGYIACYDRRHFSMPCAPGLKVHPYFQWGDSYPCTEKDAHDECGYLKRVLGHHSAVKSEQKEQTSLDPTATRNKKTSTSNSGYGSHRK